MIKIKLINQNCAPFKKHSTDAGWDLKCTKAFSIGPRKQKAVNLGIQVEIPEGYVGLLFPRSGLSTRKGLNLANVIGVIDSDYRGDVIAVVKNNGPGILRVKEYERICQLLVVPVLIDDIAIVDELSETERGDGGFGSTDEETESEYRDITNE